MNSIKKNFAMNLTDATALGTRMAARGKNEIQVTNYLTAQGFSPVGATANRVFTAFYAQLARK